MVFGAARAFLVAFGWLQLGCGDGSESLLDPEPTSSAGTASHGGASMAMSGGASADNGTTEAMGGAAVAQAGNANLGGVATAAGGGDGGGPPRTRQVLEPEDGKTLLVVGQDTSEIENYSQAFGRPAGVMLYTNVWDGLGTLNPSDFGGYGWSDLGHWKNDASPLVLQVGLDLDHGQNCGNCAGCTRAGFLEQLASGSGERVGVVRAIVSALRDSGHPVLLRVGYEFDAEICPGGFGKYPMEAYKSAFGRVRSILKELGAEKVALVWNAWAFQSRDPGKAVGVAPWGWYPGDELVDWIGVSVFPGAAPNDANEQHQANKRRQLADFAKAHAKPLMIAEASPRARFEPAQGEAAWNGWFSGVFEYVEQSQAKAFCYINMDWEALGMWSGQGWGNSRVQGSPVATKWEAAIGAPRFLKSSGSLYQELGL